MATYAVWCSCKSSLGPPPELIQLPEASSLSPLCSTWFPKPVAERPVSKVLSPDLSQQAERRYGQIAMAITSAAFFDLDRTLLLRASGPLVSEALRAEGLLRAEPYPGENALFGLFNLFGETLPAIALTRQGARAAKGWNVSSVKAAAEALAEPLAEAIEPFARETIEEHRAANRKLVLATTTPYDLVAPFAKLIGFDDVLATRYRVDKATNSYDGTIDGEFVWSAGKARSVVAWSRANLVDLDDSYAYSDSFFDVPMLSKVGYPVAVNPDPRLLVYASAKGWPCTWFNAPPGVPKPIDVEPQQVIQKIARRELLPWIRFDIHGIENIPSEGGALVAANHRSYLDPLVMAYAMGLRNRPVRFLAKKEVTDAPVVGQLSKALGAIRVDRGSGDSSPMIEAARCLRAGELVTVFPQGTIPRGHDFFDPMLKGRHGAARLAIETGCDIVPVGLWGSEQAWPRNAKVPYVLNLADPPTVNVVVGEPYRPRSKNVDRATTELMETISALLPDEARQQRTPSEQELARTFPRSSQWRLNSPCSDATGR